MKKAMLTFLSAVLVLTMAVPGLAASEVNLYIDGQRVRTEPYAWEDYIDHEEIPDIFYMDVGPQIVSGRAFLPIRIVSAYFGAKVEWESPRVIITLGDTTLTLTIGSNIVMIDDTPMTIDAAPFIKDGRTMVPLSFISEAFGCETEYRDGDAHIYSPPLCLDDTKVSSA